MKFIKKHLAALIVAFICLVLVILACFAVYRMFNPSDDRSVYGNRLSNAPTIDNTMIDAIKEEILATNLVNTVKYETKVVTMKFFIDVKNDTKIDKAQQLSDIISKKLSNNVLSFYDVEIFLTQNEGEFVEYPSIGYRSKSSETFSWTINKVVEGDSNEI